MQDVVGRSHWTNEAFKHVLVPHDVTTATRDTAFKSDERIDILLEIGKKFQATNPSLPQLQPIVHFVGQEVHISSLDDTFLEAFWKHPPVFRGKAMNFVSRGLPFENIEVYVVEGASASRRDDLVRSIAEDDAIHRKVYTDGSGTKLVLASLYQLQGMLGGPIFGGDLLVFRNKIRYIGKEYLGFRCHRLEHP